MTMPDSGFSLEPAGLQALADELLLLSVEVSEHAGAAMSAALQLGQALEGDAAEAAAAAASAWATLEELLAERARAVSDTLRAAVAAYRAEDLALAAGVGLGPRPPR